MTERARSATSRTSSTTYACTNEDFFARYGQPSTKKSPKTAFFPDALFLHFPSDLPTFSAERVLFQTAKNAFLDPRSKSKTPHHALEKVLTNETPSEQIHVHICPHTYAHTRNSHMCFTHMHTQTNAHTFTQTHTDTHTGRHIHLQTFAHSPYSDTRTARHLPAQVSLASHSYICANVSVQKGKKWLVVRPRCALQASFLHCLSLLATVRGPEALHPLAHTWVHR